MSVEIRLATEEDYEQCDVELEPNFCCQQIRNGISIINYVHFTLPCDNGRAVLPVTMGWIIPVTPATAG